MKLTRALPAFLALSLLTGCDINAFLPKTPDGKGAITNPNTNDVQLQLTEAELKSVNALEGGLFDALAQGNSTAGVVNTLKSVAAFTGGSASGYRISSVDGPIVWNPVDTDHEHYTKLKDKFSGDFGTGNHSWHLRGDFTLLDGLTATGTASLATNGATATLGTMKDFAATVTVEMDVKDVPQDKGEEIKSLANSRINLTIEKPVGPIQDFLEGYFTMSKGDVTSKGLLEVDLLRETWKITILSKDEAGNDVALRLTSELGGSGRMTVYALHHALPVPGQFEMKDVNFDKMLWDYSWGRDGIVYVNRKPTPVRATWPRNSF